MNEAKKKNFFALKTNTVAAISVHWVEHVQRMEE